MARIATLVARTRAESPHTLLALAGDTISPSVMSAVLRGEQMIAAWNQLGLDVATFGNHEFDFGPADAARADAGVALRVGVDERAGPRHREPFGGARATHVVERDGVPVGFFGLTVPDTPQTSSPGPGIEFRDPIASARGGGGRAPDGPPPRRGGGHAPGHAGRRADGAGGARASTSSSAATSTTRWRTWSGTR